MPFGIKEIDENEPIDEFIPSSLLISTFVPDEFRENLDPQLLSQSLCLKMPTISNLYIYTNPPPVGYGSPGPKVAESIIRAQDYNLKPEGTKEKNINGFTVNAGYWEDEDSPFPLKKVSGNWHPGESYKMIRLFKEEHNSEITSSIDETVDYIIRTNANVLTTGRQTWCPLSETSCPSPDAYLNMISYLQENGEENNHSLFTFIQTLHTQRKEMTFYDFSKTTTMRKSMDRKRHQLVSKIITKRKRTKVLNKNPSSIERRLLVISSTFCSYIKHGERGKLHRRAIASPNILMRAYLNIIEYFHLTLSKKLPGTTIAMGGDEKKLRILKEVSSVNSAAHPHVYTATQDATKFNECMNADLFALMHLVFFNFENNEQTESEKLLLKIFTEGNFLLAIKRITLGQGPTAYSKENDLYNKLDYYSSDLCRFNDRTRTWLEKIRDRMDQKYVQARPGMLMGMHNAAATTISYIPAGYRQDKENIIYKTLRSSDDSLSVIAARTSNHLVRAMCIEYLCMKLIGLNLATSKSYWIQGPLGEYNSWYMDGGFTAQYGTETSAIRPQGISPGDDFGVCAMSTSSALAQHCINPIGAQMRIIIGLSHIRRIWRINKEAKENLSEGVQFLGDGGENPWTAMSCGLEETSLRYYNCKTDSDLEYYWRILNPENPFNKEPSEELTYNKEMGIMTSNEIESPRTVFHFALRHNRTFRGSSTTDLVDQMKNAAQACTIMETANPALKIISYQTTESCANYIAETLSKLREECSDQLSSEDKNRISKCISKMFTDETENEPVNEDEDAFEDD